MKSQHHQDSLQSQGGKARAAKLSTERKKDIAERAAAARWGKDLPTASHEGPIKLGDVTIQSAVLKDGRRVLTQSDFMIALGRARQAKGRAYYAGDVNLPAFLTAQNLKPFIDNDLTVTSSQIEFRPLKGVRAFGYSAELLPKVCEVFLKARDAGALVAGQMHIAKQADILMRGLAHIGIIALVDEATGYQFDRARDALAKILEEFIAKELQPWTRTFPLDFYREIFRLKGWPFDPATMQGPRVLGKYTNNIVYERLAPDVLKNLREKNPVVDGRRKHKHFQWLTGEVGHPKLLAHLEGTKMLMKVSSTWEEFLERMDKFYPVHMVTELGLEVPISRKPSGKIINV